MANVSTDQCENKHQSLEKKVDQVVADVAYIRGKLDQQDKQSRDWWTRGLAVAAILGTLIMGYVQLRGGA